MLEVRWPLTCFQALTYFSNVNIATSSLKTFGVRGGNNEIWPCLKKKLKNCIRKTVLLILGYSA